jgi:hypothetical protein
LRKVGLEENTPLFYYLLKEAELLGSAKTLGPAGSAIVFEVIDGALRADPASYINVFGESWRLPRWRFPNGRQEPIPSLIGIIRLTGDHALQPECEAKRRSALPEILQMCS